jgi:hypothetical protein
MEIAKVIEVAIGFLAGGLVTWLCSKYYYEEAAKTFKKEVADLQRLNGYMLLGMENMGWITLNRDSQGRILNFVHKINVHDALQAIDSASPTLSLNSKETGKGVEPE